MSLHINVKAADLNAGNSPVDHVLSFMACQAVLEKKRGLYPEGPSLDVTFLHPEPDEPPRFDGMRVGCYTQENNILFFETYIPEKLLTPENTNYYLALVMQDVVTHASHFFREINKEFDAGRWRIVMSELAAYPVKEAIRH